MTNEVAKKAAGAASIRNVSDSVRVELIRTRAIKVGRACGVGQDAMAIVLQRWLERAGYPPDAIEVDGRNNVFSEPKEQHGKP